MPPTGIIPSQGPGYVGVVYFKRFMWPRLKYSNLIALENASAEMPVLCTLLKVHQSKAVNIQAELYFLIMPIHFAVLVNSTK